MRSIKNKFYLIPCVIIVIYVLLWEGWSNKSRLIVEEHEGRKGVLNVVPGILSPEVEEITSEPGTKVEEDLMEVFLEEQKRRKARVTEVCQHRLPYGRSFEPLIVDTKDNLAMCYIYKSASTSLVKMLAEIKGINTTNKGQNDLRKHLSVQYITRKNKKLYEKSTTIFVAVRNPLDRILSAYRSKFENASKLWYYDKLGKKMVTMYRHLEPNITQDNIGRLLKEVQDRLETSKNFTDLSSNVFANPVGPTFQEFVKYVLRNPTGDPHWLTYHAHCKMCYLKYDFIFKSENLNSEVNYFLKHMNINVTLAKMNSNSDGLTKSQLCSYWSTISEEDLHLLIKLYSADFSMFDYSYDAHLRCFKTPSLLH